MFRAASSAGPRAGPAFDSMDPDVAARITRLVRACQACIEGAALVSRADRVEIAHELADRLEAPASGAETRLLRAMLGAVATAFEAIDAAAAPPVRDGSTQSAPEGACLAELRRAFLARVQSDARGGAGLHRPAIDDRTAAVPPEALASGHRDGDLGSAASSPRNGGDDLADRAACLMERDFAGRQTVADLARALHCHPRRLQQCFRLRHHTSVHRYLDRVRAAEAARLIGEVGLKVEAAALMIGLRSRKNLYALVRRTTGLTVSEVRRAGRGAA